MNNIRLRAALTPVNIPHLILIGVAIAYYQLLSTRSTAASVLFDAYIGIVLLWCVVRLTLGDARLKRSSSLVAATVVITFALLAARHVIAGGEILDYDFLRSSRFLFIMGVFAVVSGISHPARYGKRQSFTAFCSIFFFLALSMYLFQYIAGVGRPTMFSENNYEIPSLLILVVAYYAIARDGKGYKREDFVTIAAYAASLLSMSKSGVMAAAYIYLAQRVSHTSVRALIFVSLQICAVAVALVAIISLRIGDRGIEGVDRFLFLTVFWDSFRIGSVTDLLFGAGLAAPLPNEACTRLQFWANPLFDTPGYCNATVFHSFLMKSAYELGIVGTFLFLGGWWLLLRNTFGRTSGFRMLVVVGIASLSISGFNSSIVMWSIFYCAFFSSRMTE